MNESLKYYLILLIIRRVGGTGTGFDLPQEKALWTRELSPTRNNFLEGCSVSCSLISFHFDVSESKFIKNVFGMTYSENLSISVNFVSIDTISIFKQQRHTIDMPTLFEQN